MKGLLSVEVILWPFTVTSSQIFVWGSNQALKLQFDPHFLKAPADRLKHF
jgi:hypothetical protein